MPTQSEMLRGLSVDIARNVDDRLVVRVKIKRTPSSRFPNAAPGAAAAVEVNLVMWPHQARALAAQLLDAADAIEGG